MGREVGGSLIHAYPGCCAGLCCAALRCAAVTRRRLQLQTLPRILSMLDWKRWRWAWQQKANTSPGDTPTELRWSKCWKRYRHCVAARPLRAVFYIYIYIYIYIYTGIAVRNCTVASCADASVLARSVATPHVVIWCDAMRRLGARCPSFRCTPG